MLFPERRSPRPALHKESHTSPNGITASTNKCGVDTFFNILKEGLEIVGSGFSSGFIEKHSLALRAWMIRLLLKQDGMVSQWVDSFRQFQLQGQIPKWFKRTRELGTWRRRNKAISTLLPHQYISGDAITFCLAAVKHKPRQGTYVYDVLLSGHSYGIFCGGPHGLVLIRSYPQ